MSTEQTESLTLPSGQLQLGTVMVQDPRTGELLGYAFTEVSGMGQFQRWILYRDPQNSLAIAAPPEDMARWTLDDWKSAVPKLWRPGAYYVRAQADLYAFGGTYGGQRWDRIPEDLPFPTFPKGDDNLQLDPIGKLIHWQSGQWQDKGIVFVAGKLADNINSEYWLLLPGCVPAGAAAPMAVVVGQEEAPNLAAFYNLATQAWAPGAVLAITGCRNFHDVKNVGALPQLL